MWRRRRFIPAREAIPARGEDFSNSVPSGVPKLTNEVTLGENCSLVFPTSGCNPKLNFLDGLKVVAERASSRRTTSGCTSFGLPSRLVAFGPASICGQLGHSDMESTMRYLKPARNEAVREKVNEIFGGKNGH
jgi:hypothetical protein